MELILEAILAGFAPGAVLLAVCAVGWIIGAAAGTPQSGALFAAVLALATSWYFDKGHAASHVLSQLHLTTEEALTAVISEPEYDDLWSYAERIKWSTWTGIYFAGSYHIDEPKFLASPDEPAQTPPHPLYGSAISDGREVASLRSMPWPQMRRDSLPPYNLVIGYPAHWQKAVLDKPGLIWRRGDSLRGPNCFVRLKIGGGTAGKSNDEFMQTMRQSLNAELLANSLSYRYREIEVGPFSETILSDRPALIWAYSGTTPIDTAESVLAVQAMHDGYLYTIVCSTFSDEWSRDASFFADVIASARFTP